LTPKTCSFVVIILVLSLVQCAAAGQAAPTIGPQGAFPQGAADRAAGPEYRIQVGDHLEIKFFYSPELNEQVIVRPDGRISLQLIPEVEVTGLTLATLTDLLTRRYSADLNQPEVTVLVREFGLQRVFVDGEVGSPGIVALLGQMTALQAIAQAGGMKETARSTDVIIIRRGEADTPVALRVDLKKAREGSNLAQDISLAPLDIIYVPRSRIANVNLFVDQYIRRVLPFDWVIGTRWYQP
jgi:protein involved in polysaccharide export with SLBB domain